MNNMIEDVSIRVIDDCLSRDRIPYKMIKRDRNDKYVVSESRKDWDTMHVRVYYELSRVKCDADYDW